MKSDTKDRIKYVAFRFFLERGYEATNIRDVCKEVDIKPSSLYFYYGSKKDLFFSIYDDIWSENIRQLQNVKGINSKIAPGLKLFNLYKSMMEYYTEDIAKQKFLLRYHLFPPEEISDVVRDRFRGWNSEKNKILSSIIKQCLDENLLDENIHLNDYFQKYREFEQQQVIEMIVSNIKKSDPELDTIWTRFWNCMMLSEI